MWLTDMNETVVSIAEPDSISPLMQGKSKDVDAFHLDATAPKQHRAKVGSGGRISARSSIERLPSARQSLVASPRMMAQDEGPSATRQSPTQGPNQGNTNRPSSNSGSSSHDNFITQIATWLRAEKARRAAARKSGTEAGTTGAADRETSTTDAKQQGGDGSTETKRRASDASEGSLALESLQQILDKALTFGVTAVSGATGGHSHRPSRSNSRRQSIIRKARRHSAAASSDTDYVDGDVLVPSCDAVLDNSKTLAYSGGAATDDEVPQTPGKAQKDKEAWNTFKYEIVRLTHTLRLKGWRRVPMEQSSEIDVERLSGALTNAVYVVSPPKNLPPKEGKEGIPVPKNPPP